MHFSASEFAAALDDGLNHIDAIERASAQNLLWDESVSDARRDFFEAEPILARGADWPSLSKRQTDYFRKYVRVDQGQIPHTFQPSMSPASLEGVDESRLIVRLEDIDSPLNGLGLTVNDLEEAIAEGDTAFVDLFLSEWDSRRDARPSFATFKGEVVDEIEEPDWANRLCDRLGLAHYCKAGVTIQVALMHYAVSDVLADAATADPLTLPTVLDAPPWPYFFPVPRQLAYGRAMALSPCDTDESLVAEILHSRITYQRRHLLKIGVASPAALSDIEELRDRHLMALQIASGRDDFGA